MKLHRNARTCPRSRRLLVERIEEQGWSHAEAAAAAGVSTRTAAEWLARWRAEGEPGLADRPSVPHRSPHRTPERRRRLVLALRRLRLTAAEIAQTPARRSRPSARS
jgi:transposase